MPIEELKGFERISLKKGGSHKVTTRLKKDLLHYWNEERGCFVRPSGDYIIMAGASPVDICL